MSELLEGEKKRVVQNLQGELELQLWGGKNLNRLPFSPFPLCSTFEEDRQAADPHLKLSHKNTTMSDSENSISFNISDDLVPTRERIPAGRITETHLDGLLSSPLRLIEDLTTGCGGQLWPAGIRLAKYVIRRYGTEGLHGKRIVELGAGGGVTGLAVAMEVPGVGEAKDGVNGVLWMTDIEDMVELMKKNVALNQLDGKVEAGLLDW